MLHVDDIAKNKLAEIKNTENLSEDFFLRVGVVSGGCSGLSYQMGFDNKSLEGDQEFFDNGVKIITDTKSVLYLAGTTLKFTDGLNGKGFFFENPNASRTCGCGDSFSV